MAQLLHLVFGGKVEDPRTVDFADLNSLEVVGIFPDYQSAYEAWRGKSQASIDDAYTNMSSFISTACSSRRYLIVKPRPGGVHPRAGVCRAERRSAYSRAAEARSKIVSTRMAHA